MERSPQTQEFARAESVGVLGSLCVHVDPAGMSFSDLKQGRPGWARSTRSPASPGPREPGPAPLPAFRALRQWRLRALKSLKISRSDGFCCFS